MSYDRLVAKAAIYRGDALDELLNDMQRVCTDETAQEICASVESAYGILR